MNGHVARGRCRRGRASGEVQAHAKPLTVLLSDLTHMVLTLIPGTLVERLFLAPHHLLEILVVGDGGLELFLREGIELLDTDDGNIFTALLGAIGGQVIVDLARTQHDALDLGSFQVALVGQHHLEAAIGQLVEGGSRFLVTQQRLG